MDANTQAMRREFESEVSDLQKSYRDTIENTNAAAKELSEKFKKKV